MKQFYKIADLLVEMDSFGRTEEQAKKYIYNKNVINPDIVIQSNIKKAQNRFPKLSESECEYMATGANFYKNIIRYNGFMLHSSAVVVNGKAYLFTADSGVGKSTHTQNWLKLFEDCAYILNDDKPALRQIDGIWYAYGTPWSGKKDISRDVKAPIAGIAYIERGLIDSIEPLCGMEAIKVLLKQVNKPNDSILRGRVLELVNELINEVPVWKLKCTEKKESAILSYEKMSNEGI